MSNEEKNKPHNCCPVFNPVPWDNVTHEWKDRLFIMDTVPQILHIPLPGYINKVMARMWKKAEDAGAAVNIEDFLLLAYDPSPWKCEYYLSVTKEISGAENVKISGTFFSKVFDGPFSSVPKFIKEMDRLLKKEGKKAKKYYFYYTTCPNCAKKYGHNYIVTFAEV
jgi:hypothetical protein